MGTSEQHCGNLSVHNYSNDKNDKNGFERAKGWKSEIRKTMRD